MFFVNMWLLGIIYLLGLSELSDCNDLKTEWQWKLNELTKRAGQHLPYSEYLWHNYKFDTGVGNREALVVNNVRSIDDFNYGHNVKEWKSVNLRNESFIIGLQTSSLTILRVTVDDNQTKFVVNEKQIDLHKNISSYTVFKCWNRERRVNDVIVVVSVETVKKFDDMIWYRITEDFQLVEIWFWHLRKRVTHMRVFDYENQAKLLLIHEKQIDSNRSTADVYDFVLHINEPDFWLSQTIPLNCSSKSSAINNYGPNIYLSIPQNCSNTVNIYEFNGKRFTTYGRLNSSNVDHVSNFNIGPRSFIAVGGREAAVYKFTQTGLKKEIVDIKLTDVNYYLPIPINNYREDVLLLVQYNLNHSTHLSNIVRILLYSNELFNVHDEIPCRAYGEDTHGLTCITDEEIDSGIYGSAIISIGGMLGVVVPRHEMHSGLFLFQTSLNTLENPVTKIIQKIITTKDKLNDIFSGQQQKLLKIRQVIQEKTIPEKTMNEPEKVSILTKNKRQTNSSSRTNKLTDIINRIDRIKEEILRQRSSFDETLGYSFIVNGSLQVTGTTFVENLVVRTINDVNFNDIYRNTLRSNDRIRKYISGKKTFSNGFIKNLTLTTLNNNDARKVAYKTGEPHLIKGNITFDNFVRVKNLRLSPGGTVNNIRLEDELVLINTSKVYDDLRFRELKVKSSHSLFLNGYDMRENQEVLPNNGMVRIESSDLFMPNTSLFIKNLNGEPFDEFIRRIYLKKGDTQTVYFVPGVTTVLGNVNVRGRTHLGKLNNLTFPYEYLVKKPTGDFTKITGHKKFVGKVTATEVIGNGLVDGVDPHTIITKSLNSNIKGEFTLADLEVTESLNVNQNIFGPGVEDYLNPTLKETHHVVSNINFKSLEVTGVITIGNLKGINMSDILSDVVLLEEKDVVINSRKNITEVVVENLRVDSHEINDINLGSFFTKDTEQDLNFEVINGDINIDNIDIYGYLDEMDMSTELENIVRIDRDEKVDAELIFENPKDLIDINSPIVNIQYLDQARPKHFGCPDRLSSEQVFIEGNFIGDIKDFDLKEYEEHRMSLTKPQNITGTYKIDQSNLDHVQLDSINDVDFHIVEPFVNINENMMLKLYDGDIEIDELHVNGTVNMMELNGYDIHSIARNAFWLDKDNDIPELTFTGEVEFEDLTMLHLNDQNYQSFLFDIILKNETSLTFSGDAIFENGFKTNNLNTKFINDHDVNDLLVTNKEQVLSGNVVVHGDVYVSGDTETSSLNDIPVSYLKNIYQEEEGQEFIIKDNVEFDKEVNIDHLYITGSINDMDLDDYLSNLVRISNDLKLPGTIVFKNEVTSNKNLHTETINGMNIDDLKEVILKTHDDTIDGSITFAEDVTITDTLEVDHKLETSHLSGCNLEGWEKDVSYWDDNFSESNLIFETVTLPELTVEYLNGIDMNSLILLNEEQVIDVPLSFNTITVESDIPVGGLVNGYRLEQEFSNSVLLDMDQVIESEIIFTGPVVVNRGIETTGRINGKDLNRLVTLYSNQNLTATYSFEGKTTADSLVGGLINGIDLIDWFENSISSKSEDGAQYVTNPVVVHGNVRFENGFYGDGFIGGWNLSYVSNFVQKKLSVKNDIEQQLKDSYKEVCYGLRQQLNRAKFQIYKFKYFEDYQLIKLENKINQIHTVKVGWSNFLLISEKDSCVTHVYEWLDNHYTSKYFTETGEVDEFVTIKTDDHIYLVTKSNVLKDCGMRSVNLWILTRSELTHIQELDDTEGIQESKLPGVFYGINKGVVSEYRVYSDEEEIVVHRYRSWNVPDGEYVFNPHERTLGLSLRNSEVIYKLSRKETERTVTDYNSPELQGIVYEIPNSRLPFDEGEVVVLHVGMPDTRRTLVAVATHEKTSVKGYFDFITIYEDISTGEVFHKVPTYKPSCLTTMDFGDNGETLLVFMEDESVLQIYEYKGMAGFQRKFSLNMQASKISTVSLPLPPYGRERKFLLLINNNVVSVIQAVMDGDRPDVRLDCD